MKKLPLFLFIGAIGLLVYALIYLDGGNVKITTGNNSTPETKKVESKKARKEKKAKTAHEFDKIEVDGIFEVVVTYGSKEKITLESPDGARKEIELKVESGTLIVKLDRSTSLLYKKGAKIHVYTAKLNDFLLEGAASVQLKNTLKDHSFTIKSSGAASFEGRVEVTEAAIELEGASSVELSGMAKQANLNLSGAGNLSGFDFKVNSLSVEMNGLSKANITSLSTLEGDLSGISKLTYSGNPSVKNVKTSGSASVNLKQ